MRVIFAILTIAGWAWTLIVLMTWLIWRAKRRLEPRGFEVVRETKAADEQR
jgi:hypothetical protein